MRNEKPKYIVQNYRPVSRTQGSGIDLYADTGDLATSNIVDNGASASRPTNIIDGGSSSSRPSDNVTGGTASARP